MTFLGRCLAQRSTIKTISWQIDSISIERWQGEEERSQAGRNQTGPTVEEETRHAYQEASHT